MSLRFKLLLMVIPAILSAVLFSVGIAAVIFHEGSGQPVIAALLGGVLFLTVATTIAVIAHVFGSAGRVLANMAEVTHRIGKGDFKTELPENSDIGEIQHLLSGMKRMQVNLQTLEEKIREEEKDAKMGQIASHVAHDLAGPLSSVQTALGYLHEHLAESKKGADAVNLLDLGVKRLKEISRDLLNIQKGVEEKKRLFSLHEVLDELVGEYETQDNFSAVRFVKKYHREAISLLGDRGRFQRAFGNIIKNAVEAMEVCGTVTLVTTTEKGEAVVFIEDDGPGMPPDILQKVLRGGYSGGKENGHGIGMTVVRNTVKEHGGTLTAVSVPGRGSSFCFHLPFPKTQSLAESDGETDSPGIFRMRHEKGRPIVVIDDDPNFLEQWRLLLERQGISALLFFRYEDFSGCKITPALTSTAIVDYHFENSELDGLEVIEKLRKTGFENVYLCTVEYWKPFLKQRTEKLGVPVCPKPLPGIELVYDPGAKPPVAVSHPGFNVLVVDDDVSIRMAWEIIQAKLNIAHLDCFSGLEELSASNIDYRKIDLAFVDKNIEGSRFAGYEVIDYLHSRGVSKIILASGENAETLKNDPRFGKADCIINEKIPGSLREFFS